MSEIMKDVTYFVTIALFFLTGTRIAWVCGRNCQFKIDPKTRKRLVIENLPAASIVYFFGFLIVYGFFISNFIAIVLFALFNATLLAAMVVSMAMPELKRRPDEKVADNGARGGQG